MTKVKREKREYLIALTIDDTTQDDLRIWAIDGKAALEQVRRIVRKTHPHFSTWEASIIDKPSNTGGV